MDNFSEALVSLNSIGTEYDIFVPSLNRKVKFKGLNTKQQKEAVKSALENGFIGVSFSNFLNNVLKENCTESIDFLLTDKAYIITVLRVLSLSKDIKVGDEKIDFSFIVNLNNTLPNSLKQKQVTDSNITIDLQIPTLSKDSDINRETLKKISNEKAETLSKETVGEMFVNEIVKYISKVSINNNDKTVDLDFKDLSFQQRVQLVERLPLTINTKVFEYINQVRAFEKESFKIDGKPVELVIDPSFFTV